MTIRTWGADRKGPWALTYGQVDGSGVMLSASPQGWLVSFGLFSRFGAGVGWQYRGHRSFTWQFPAKRS